MTGSSATHSIALCEAIVASQAVRDPLHPPQNGGDQVIANTLLHQDPMYPPFCRFCSIAPAW